MSKPLVFKVHGYVQGSLITAARHFKPGSRLAAFFYDLSDRWWFFWFRRRWPDWYRKRGERLAREALAARSPSPSSPEQEQQP